MNAPAPADGYPPGQDSLPFSMADPSKHHRPGEMEGPETSHPYEEAVGPEHEEASEGATPHALSPRDPGVDGMDPTTLEQQITHWNQMRALLTAYIRQNMQEGIDYYILLLGGRPSKPSLSKAGSEKFLSLFNLQARFRKDEETWDMLGRPAGVICYVCALYTKHGAFVGEGRGAREVAKDQDLNKAIKMAQKSAQIDAILRIGALSDSFTQDVEDQQPPQALTVRDQKRRIVALLQQLGMGAADKAGCEEAVRQYTSLSLVPAHYLEIIHRLERGVQEHGHRETRNAGAGAPEKD